MYTIKMSERKYSKIHQRPHVKSIIFYQNLKAVFFSLDIIMIFFEMSQKYFDNINDILYK